MMKKLNSYINEGLFKNVGIGSSAMIEKWLLEHGIKQGQFSITNQNTIEWIVKDEDLHLIIKNDSDKGLPNYIKMPTGFPGSLTLEKCPHWETFEGLPTMFTGGVTIRELPKLKSLEGIDEIYYLYISHMPKLTSLDGMGDRVNGLELYQVGIKNLKGLGKYVNELTLEKCDKLTSLEGMPRDISDLKIFNCDNLKSLKGISKRVCNSFQYEGHAISDEEVNRDCNCIGYYKVINGK